MLAQAPTPPAKESECRRPARAQSLSRHFRNHALLRARGRPLLDDRGLDRIPAVCRCVGAQGGVPGRGAGRRVTSRVHTKENGRIASGSVRRAASARPNWRGRRPHVRAQGGACMPWVALGWRARRGRTRLAVAAGFPPKKKRHARELRTHTARPRLPHKKLTRPLVPPLIVPLHQKAPSPCSSRPTPGKPSSRYENGPAGSEMWSVVGVGVGARRQPTRQALSLALDPHIFPYPKQKCDRLSATCGPTAPKTGPGWPATAGTWPRARTSAAWPQERPAWRSRPRRPARLRRAWPRPPRRRTLPRP